MKKAKDSKEYDAMLFAYIEKELEIFKKKDVSKKERTKKKESKVLNEKR